MRNIVLGCMAVAVAAGLAIQAQDPAVAGTAAATTVVFTANNTGSSVSALEGDALGRVAGDIPVSGTAGALDVSPDGLRVYSVGGTSGDRITVIDATTHVQVTSVELSPAEKLTDVAVSPDSATVYVTTGASASVFVFDAAGLAKSGTFPLDQIDELPTTADAIEVSPDGTALFVLDEAHHQVVKLSATDGELLDVTEVGNDATEIALSPDGAVLVAVGPEGVQFLHTGDLGRVTDDDHQFGEGLDVATAGTRAYVLNRQHFTTYRPSIDVYEVATGQYVASIDLGNGMEEGAVVYGIAVASDGSCAYVTRAGAENGGTVTRVDLQTGTLGPTGNTGGDPLRVALREALEAPVTVAPFILPRKLDLKLKGDGKDTLAVAGTFDDGGATVDYAEEVTIEVGGFSRSFVPVPNGKGAFAFKDATFAVKLTPNVKGSSRGLFKFKLRKASLAESIDPSESVTFHFRGAGLPDAAGQVVLTNGRYRIQRVRGALVAPGVFPVKAVAKLGTGDVGRLKLVGGLATNGQTPAALGDVRVGFGPAFSRVIPGESFTRRGDVFTYVLPGRSGLSIRIDFRREVFFVTARNAALGTLDTATVDVVFDAGNGQGAFSNTVRLGRSGAKRLY